MICRLGEIILWLRVEFVYDSKWVFDRCLDVSVESLLGDEEIVGRVLDG